jgi:hypothetical protein
VPRDDLTRSMDEVAAKMRKPEASASGQINREPELPAGFVARARVSAAAARFRSWKAGSFIQVLRFCPALA